MCRSKIGQNLGPVHWIEKKNYFQKKHFFYQKFFFEEKKIFRFNALGPNFFQFYSYTYQNIRYILLVKVPKKNQKQNFQGQKFTPFVTNWGGEWNLKLPFWHDLSPTTILWFCICFEVLKKNNNWNKKKKEKIIFFVS